MSNQIGKMSDQMEDLKGQNLMSCYGRRIISGTVGGINIAVCKQFNNAILPQEQTFFQPWCEMRRHLLTHEHYSSFPKDP